MADIANIRRRRLERLANNFVPAEDDGPVKESSKGGGIMEEPTKDSIIPSEFECILCLRCACSHNRGTGRGVMRIVHSEGFALLPFFCLMMTLPHQLLARGPMSGNAAVFAPHTRVVGGGNRVHRTYTAFANIMPGGYHAPEASRGVFNPPKRPSLIYCKKYRSKLGERLKLNDPATQERMVVLAHVEPQPRAEAAAHALEITLGAILRKHEVVCDGQKALHCTTSDVFGIAGYAPTRVARKLNSSTHTY